jgi:hypothetical protein
LAVATHYERGSIATTPRAYPINFMDRLAAPAMLLTSDASRANRCSLYAN